MYVKPYVPSHFARQFGYDQLYVSNPNAGLCFSENLFKGARAWYYRVAEGHELFSACLTKRPIVIPASVSARGTFLLVGCLVLK